MTGQSPTGESSRDDLVTDIRRRHAAVKALIQAASQVSVSSRADVWVELLRMIAIHEATLLTVLAEGGPRQVAWRRWEDQLGRIGQCADQLDDLGPTCRTFAVRLALLATEVEEHLRVTETGDLVRMLDAADDADVTRCLRILQHADELLHESGPSCAVPAHGSFAALFRAARQALSNDSR